MKNLPKWIPPVLGGLLVLLAVLLAGKLWLWDGPGGSSERLVDISPKSGTRAIARQLKASGAIRSMWLFRVYSIMTGQTKHLKAGEYSIAPGAGIGEIVAQLADGRVRLHSFTIPEGLTLKQIADKLQAEGLAQGDAFLDAAMDTSLLKMAGVPASSAEGFLFPDTYELAKGLEPGLIVQMMLKHFQEKCTPDLVAAAQAQGLNLLQWVTLASIIEREVKIPEERAKAASVFTNRLARRMRLESCATVLYSQGRTSGTLTLADVRTPSPFNTYLHRGLPPGPICNPGLSSLTAAAHPAKTDYFFFVVKPNGEHVFSHDYEAHLRAKRDQERARRNHTSNAGGTRP